MPCLTNGVEPLCHAMSPFPPLMLVAATLEQNSVPSILETPSQLKTALFSSTPVLIGSNGVNGDTAWHCRCSLARCTMDGFRSEIAQWQSPQKMQSTPGGKRRQKNAEESRPRSTRRARGLRRRRRGREWSPRRVVVGLSAEIAVVFEINLRPHPSRGQRRSIWGSSHMTPASVLKGQLRSSE